MYLDTIISAVVSVLVSFPLGMFFERRKKTAEARGAELGNVEKEIAIYRRMLDDAEAFIQQLQRRGEELEEKLERYREENIRLKAENQTLKRRHD